MGVRGSGGLVRLRERERERTKMVFRYLIEGATGVFTGSIYKDLELQMKGFWGEIRDWRDGTTLVQKTHDGGAQYIRSDSREKVAVNYKEMLQRGL